MLVCVRVHLNNRSFGISRSYPVKNLLRSDINTTREYLVHTFTYIRLWILVVLLILNGYLCAELWFAGFALSVNIDHGTNFFYVDRIHWVFIAQNVQYFDRSTRALWMDNGQF